MFELGYKFYHCTEHCWIISVVQMKAMFQKLQVSSKITYSLQNQSNHPLKLDNIASVILVYSNYNSYEYGADQLMT